jgi:hypothetical protein
MKNVHAVLLPVLVQAVAIFIPKHSFAQSDYSVTERGADYAVHQKTVVENGTNRVHSYTELATGLNYTNSYGQLVESKEEIDVLPHGGAAATQGRHKVYFPGDISSGVIEVVTPDGLHLKSRPLGISYDDGTNTVLIGQLTNSIGVLVSSNQVVYPNAFTGLDADLRYTYRKGGFEQDIVLQEQPPTPESFGLSSQNARLQVLTEFFNPPEPKQTKFKANLKSKVSKQTVSSDTTLTFGKMKMVQGRAFAMNSESGKRKAETSAVSKSWVHLQGRTFLIEELPVQAIATQLQQLPPPTAATMSSANTLLHKVSATRLLPPIQMAQAATNAVRLAKRDINYQSGVVLDYDEIDEDQTDFTFTNGTTYYISGTVNLTGVTTFQGGAIIKYADDGNLALDDTSEAPDGNPAAVWPESADQPAVFTSVDDNSVGEAIGSGTPTTNDTSYFSFEWRSWDVDAWYWKNIRVFYAGCVVRDDTGGGCPTMVVSDSQFFDCNVVLASCAGSIQFNNNLFSGCTFVVVSAVGSDIQGANITVDQCGSFNDDPSFNGNSVELYNSLVTGVADFTSASDFYFVAGYYAQLHLKNTLIAGHLETYNTNQNSGRTYNLPDCLAGFASPSTQAGCVTMIDSSQSSSLIGSAAGIYTSAAWASNYLAAGSPYRDVGTTNIDAGLLAELQTMTTYAPQDGGFPDTNTPDLGYHYPTNEDLDFDGLPDWWEWNYFHSYAYSGTNLDANGNTLLSDYTNNLDPNIISFTLAVTNNYVNNMDAPVQLDVTAGTPDYYAVLVNDTNLADASWQPYSGSSLNVFLGATDGSYTVSVGLRGLPANATQTWQSETLILDTVAPLVTITNPAISTVSRPMIQLQGLANENLSSLTFDVSNAAGIFTNQTGYWNPVFYDTNLLAFTTNTFQCYDIALTNGLNTVTLHATDLAGNVTVTNVSYTVDYSGDHTAPVLNVVWPQDGAQIGGSSFTFEGQVDDDTASVSAQIVDTNGVTNLVQGLVERDGSVTAGNVPLSAGTNYLTVTATDAAGNFTVTNLTLVDTNSSFADTSPPGFSSVQPPFVALENYTADIDYSGDASGRLKVQWNYVNGGNYDMDCVFQVEELQSFGVSDLAPDGTNYTTPATTYGFNGFSTVDGSPVDYAFFWSEFSPIWRNANDQIEFDSDTFQKFFQTTTMIVPSGPKLPGVTKTYTVRACARFAPPPVDDSDVLFGLLSFTDTTYGTPVPPEQLQINGKALADSGTTNSDGSVWGTTSISAPAGALVPLTVTTTNPTNNDYSFNVEIVKDKLYWQNMVQAEIDTESGVVIENYLAGNGFLNNRKNIQGVYKFYEKLFVQNTNFLWAGLAKLAGAPVYGGLSDAQQVSIFWTNVVFLNELETNINAEEALALETNGVAFIQTFQQTLIQMNINILNDLAWQFEAYKNGGLAAIQTAYAYGNSGLDQSATNDWGEIDQGIPTGNTASIQDGNEKLLQREQQQVLANGYSQLTAMSNSVTWAMSEFAKNPVPSGPDFITLEPGGNIANYPDRWNWITNSSNGMWPLWTSTPVNTQLQWVKVPLTTYATNYAIILPLIQ